ncbi:MAG TPA: roadblock/LC7 domain-containing protein [Methanobacterium sp.]|jgi:predicted regulator of Ras-like GTPase activity (Roadblock/LC7/MglB family)|nr:MAG: hypothetical protein FGO69_01945 [Methanobacterium sp.]HOI70714.1 roadblock/LC7 domain-containing protein [Methanobacterium sp.]HPX77373.1 roadblock/LC7 domain-containing protein [Methanobacterium sp.]
MNSELKIELDKTTSELVKTDGVNGSLIVDINGEVLSHHLLQDLDIELFGPMSNVITGSSKRLIDVSNHGIIERVLVESEKGKALFLHLGNVLLIVLMENTANVGFIMIASKRAAQKIIDITKDLTIVQLEELEEEIAEPEPIKEKAEHEPIKEKSAKPEPVEKQIPEPVEIVKEPVPEPIKEVAEVEPKEESVEATVTETTSEEITAEQVTAEPETTEKVTKEPEIYIEEPKIISGEQDTPAREEPKVTIPVIKPPIAFPKLEKVTEIPDDDDARLDLILKIYESIFLAMSIGASKIMGVAPARGLTRKFLPVDECKVLLDGVDVKNNSSIDFAKIKENADKIPVSNREMVFKESFGKIITIITENYGKVMGYSAFKGMIRPEFKIINESFGHLLDDLGIKEQIHPELRDFFN